MDDYLKEKLAQITPKRMEPGEYTHFMTSDLSLVGPYLSENTVFNGVGIERSWNAAQKHIIWLEQNAAQAEPPVEKVIKAMLTMYEFGIFSSKELLDMILAACEEAGQRNERTERTLEICGYLTLLKMSGGQVDTEAAIEHIKRLIGVGEEIPPPTGVQWAEEAAEEEGEEE